jgi:hypothetical protein
MLFEYVRLNEKNTLPDDSRLCLISKRANIILLITGLLLDLCHFATKTRRHQVNGKGDHFVS